MRRRRIGREVGFQLIINDGGAAHVWYQGVKLWRNPHHVHRVRLAEAPGARDIFQVTQVKQIKKQIKNSLLMDLGIVKRGGGYPTNNAVTVRSGDGAIVTNVVHGRGRNDLRLSPPPFGRPWQKLVFEVDGENVGEYVLDTDTLYQVELNKIPITFAERVFDGSTFPACDYSDPARARSLIGDYTIEVRFYDANNAESSHALRPGRYGAVVTTRAGSARIC